MKHISALRLVLAIAASGCLADSATSSGRPPSPVKIGVVPESPHQAVPQVVHLRLHGLDAQTEATHFHIYTGKLTASQIQRVWDDDPSQTVQTRELKAQRWPIDARTWGLAVQQRQPLGSPLTIVTLLPPSAHHLTVTETPPNLPFATRRWPMRASQLHPTHAIYCSDDLLPTGTAIFAPQMAEHKLLQGVGPGDSNPHCIYAPGLSSDNRWTAPLPQLLGHHASASTWLDPSPIEFTMEQTQFPDSEPCPSSMLEVAAGCMEVLDDRIRIYNGARPMFWSIVIENMKQTPRFTALEAQQSWLIHPLPPASQVVMFATTVDEQGRTHGQRLLLQTQAPRAHVVINEVLANPMGPEPQQEWVELYNDGLAPAELESIFIEDIGGRVQLPSTVLQPGAFALLVNEDFDASGEYDPRPAPGTLLLRVPKLGKDGLKNSGEPLKLLDENGVVLSRFPARPRPKEARSVYRVHPRASDDEPASFALSTEGMSTPGAANPSPRER